MAKANFQAEVDRILGRLNTADRDTFPLYYPHRLTIKWDTMISGFQAALEARAKAKGIDTKDIAVINSRSNWYTACVAGWNKLKGGNAIDGDWKKIPAKVSTFNKLAARKGVWIESEDASGIVLVQPATKDLGGSALISTGKKKAFDSSLRSAIWKSWIKSNGKQLDAKGISKDYYIRGERGYTVGESQSPGNNLPSAHKTTLGAVKVMEMFGELKADGEGNQELDKLGGYLGNITTNTEVFSSGEEILKALGISWSHRQVVDEKGGISSKRVIEVEIDSAKTNTIDRSGDLQRLKKDISKNVEDQLNELVKKSDISDDEFSTSKSLREAAIDETIRKLKLPLTKKGTVDKRFKVVKDFIKTTKTPKKVETSGRSKPKVTGNSRRVSKGAMLKMAPIVSKTRQTREKGKQGQNLAKMQTAINRRLPAEVRRNMGRPALINRTGRFSDSAELVRLKQGPNTIMGDYTYQLNPYETFENTGEREWPAGYNPKTLIAKSIRNLAVGMTTQKFTLRRV